MMLRLGFNISRLSILDLFKVFYSLLNEGLQFDRFFHRVSTNNAINEKFLSTLKQDVDIMIEVLVRVS